MSKRESLQSYQEGRLTLRELARTLRLDVWAAQDLLAAEGVAVAQGGRGETAAAWDGLLSARRDPAPSLAQTRQRTERELQQAAVHHNAEIRGTGGAGRRPGSHGRDPGGAGPAKFSGRTIGTKNVADFQGQSDASRSVQAA